MYCVLHRLIEVVLKIIIAVCGRINNFLSTKIIEKPIMLGFVEGHSK